jgi:hypothetical protein
MPRTQKELLTEQRAELDQAWREKYPMGQFVIQRWSPCGKRERQNLYWNSRRNTSATKYRGVGIESEGPYGEPGPIRADYQNNSFGRCTYYQTLERLRDAALKFGFSQAQVDLFEAAYFETIQ